MGGAVSVPMLSLQGVVECFNAVVVYIIEISVCFRTFTLVKALVMYDVLPVVVFERN